MDNQVKLYLIGIEYYKDPETDSKETDYMNMGVIASSYSEAETKIIETLGLNNIKRIDEMTESDYVLVQ